MRFTIYEVASGVWSFDAPPKSPVKPRAFQFLAPLDARLVRVHGEPLIRCTVGGREKLVAADVARACARRDLHGFKIG